MAPHELKAVKESTLTNLNTPKETPSTMTLTTLLISSSNTTFSSSLNTTSTSPSTNPSKHNASDEGTRQLRLIVIERLYGDTIGIINENLRTQCYILDVCVNANGTTTDKTSLYATYSLSIVKKI